MKTKIELNQEDIDAGGHHSSGCPTQRAIKRASGKDDVWVGTRDYGLSGHTFALPLHVAEWIRLWDYGYAPKPFTFELEIP